MNSKIDQSKGGATGGDVAKYVVAALLVVAGLFFWFWFSTPENAARLGSWGAQIRGLVVALGLVAGALVFFGTGKGRGAREFLSESRFELRKVVWPTRQEAFRTTWVVIVVVVVLSLILAGFDFVIQKLVTWFLNVGR